MCVGSLRNPQNVDVGLASTCCPFLGSGPREGRSQPRAPTGTGVEMTPRAERLRHVNSLTVFYCKEVAVGTWDTGDTQSRSVLSEEREKDPYIQKL